VVAALDWAVNEMEKRYKLFAEIGVRNIEGYNEMSCFQALPYLVVILDELADIILFAPSKVEDAITRLAQMARATGIHLVLATQRPSVDVITGLIKANIPTRIAFNVASAVDSRVIIDSVGAEKLLGKGDMLYVPPESSKPKRIQGTYVSDKEIKAMIDHLKSSGVEPDYTEEVTTKFATKKLVGPDGIEDEVDDMFADSIRVVVSSGKASASLLQRRLSIGYARAARILDQLEAAGIISPAEGSKPRDVLIADADAYLSGGQES
jgi:S-DNA-T family DNA segregation ATPase FtsK/SpoIIIE